MRRLWNMRPLTPKQKTWRLVEPVYEDGYVINGCIPMDEYAEEVQEELAGAAVEFTTLWESGDMPILKYGDAFVQWRKEQIEANTAL